MTRIKLVLCITGLLIFSNIKAQELSKEERKVQIFSSEEKDNLQQEMSQYSSIIVYYIAKISRLDDMDKEYSEERFKKELNSLLAKQDKELEDLLTPEQFEIHKEIYGEFLRSAYKRWGISDS
jgi:flagellar biosynthesis regulator FlbT